MEIEEIKAALVKSCITGSPSLFIPYLLSKKVITSTPDKIGFYLFFEPMVNTAIYNSVGKLKLEIERSTWLDDEDVLSYEFYDEIHAGPRLSIIIKESENSLYLEVLPF